MEKLLELMNDYAHTYADHYDDTGGEITITFFSHADNCFQYACDGGYETLVDDVVISKRFGFIKRLVDNDRINKKKLDEAERKPMYVTDDMFSLYKVDECVIMLLAISDTPIEDLISYLK